MTDYAPITDPANPFATKGLSREVRAILDCLLWAKGHLDVVATSTTDHSKYTTSGNLSRHCMDGTDGLGLGVDCRMRRRGNGIHRAVFDLWVPVERRLHELIYADAPYNIRRGQRVAPYAVSSHWDHVHLSVAKGEFIQLPGMSAPAPNPEEFALQIPGYFKTLVAPNGGWWHAARDGGVFAVDDGRGSAVAPFYGSAVNLIPIGAKVVDFVPYGHGYAFVVQHPDNDVTGYHFPGAA